MIKISIFRRNSFCMHSEIKKRNWSSSLYSFFFESTYHSDDCVRYFINAWVGVKEPIAALNIALTFQISCCLKIDSSRSRRSPLRVDITLLPFRYSFPSSRRISGLFNAFFRCGTKADDFVGGWLWSRHLTINVQLPKSCLSSRLFRASQSLRKGNRRDDC